MAVKDDRLALKAIKGSSKEGPKRAEILARQTEQDFLHCPKGYSSEADEIRLGELKPLWPPCGLRTAEETELAFIVARITASKAASIAPAAALPGPPS